MKEQTPTSAKRKPYDSDITDVQWNILEPMLPSTKRRGRPRKTNLREVVNVLRGDCPWWAGVHAARLCQNQDLRDYRIFRILPARL